MSEREIHSTAIVSSEANIAQDVRIGPYSVIGKNVSIGSGTRVASHVVIEGNTTIGENNNIFQFASIGAAPQDLKFRGEPSTLMIGSGNTIREYVTLQPGTEHGNMTTTIGDNNLFMASSHVGHDCVVGNNNIFANSVGLSGHVSVANGVILGGLVGIHQFCRIGDLAMLSAGSMIGLDIPPYCIAQGDRCFLRGINTIGLQRSGFSDEEVKLVKKVYRQLFSTVGGLEQKISELPVAQREHEKIKPFISFLLSSERGISNPAKNATH